MSLMPEMEASHDAGATGELRLGGRLGRMSLAGQVAVLAVWPLLEQVLAFFVGMTDLLVAARMADGVVQRAILDAMGLGAYVAWLLNILQGAVATGVMALVARATGGRDQRLAGLGLGQGLWLGFAAGIVALVFLQAGIPFLIRWVGLSDEAAVLAVRFFRTLAFSGPLSGMLLAVNAALRGAGDTRTPFVSMLVVNVVNMAACVVFVFGPVPFGGHGVVGIAAGTVTGWGAGLAVSCFMLGSGGREGLRWSADILRPQTAIMRRIARIGMPQAFEILGMWVINIFGVRLIARHLAVGSLGAHMLAIRSESMSFLPGFAIATAAATLAGQYLGAGSKEMAVRAVRLCWKLAAGMMGLIGLGFVCFRGPLIGWMAPGSELHLRLAAPLLLVSACTQPFFASCIILKNSMRGAGASAMVLRWSFGSMVFYRVVLLWLIANAGHLSLVVVWIVFGCDVVTQAAVFAWLHFRGHWLDAEV